MSDRQVRDRPPPARRRPSPRGAGRLGGARGRLREQRAGGPQLSAPDDRRGPARRRRRRRPADARPHRVGRQLPAHRPGELARAVPVDGALHPDGRGHGAPREARPGHRRQGRVPALQGRADVVRAPSASAGSRSGASACARSWRRGSRAHAIDADPAAAVGGRRRRPRRASRRPTASSPRRPPTPRTTRRSPQSGRRTRNAEASREQL